MGIGFLVAAAQVVASDEDGLTWREVFADLPHDATSIVVFALVLFSVGLVVRAGRPRKAPPNRRGGAT